MMECALFSHEIGEGLPILVVHGWGAAGTVEEVDFEPIFSKMTGYRRIYVDLPGSASTPASNIKDLDDMYARLVQFVDARLGKSRFIIIGSSCGGYLVRALAQKYGNQVDGLLLRVPMIEPENSKRDLDLFKPLVVNTGLTSKLSDDDKQLLGDIPIQTPDYVQRLKTKCEDVYGPAERAADNKVLGMIREDPQRYRLTVPLDGKFVAPTLIVCGRQDPVVGYRDSLRLLELYPRSTFAVLDRGTHAIPLDACETSVFEALVRDWIFRVEEWRERIEE